MDSRFENISHPFEPVCNENSRVLILGTLPSLASQKSQFYYGHPQNRFWPLLALLFQQEQPGTIDEKICFILDHQLALWDVVQRCRMIGSADNTIQEEKVNPVDWLLDRYPVERIYANGQKAGKLYEKYIEPLTGRPIHILPSTSPANARFSLAALAEKWRVVTGFDLSFVPKRGGQTNEQT